MDSQSLWDKMTRAEKAHIIERSAALKPHSEILSRAAWSHLTGFEKMAVHMVWPPNETPASPSLCSQCKREFTLANPKVSGLPHCLECDSNAFYNRKGLAQEA